MARVLRLSDVADVRLGSSFYDLYSDIDGYPSAAIVLKQTPGSNAAEVIRKVKEKVEEIKQSRFPPNMDYAVTYDVSNFLDASIEKVVHTLFEGVHSCVVGCLSVPGRRSQYADSNARGAGVIDRDVLLHADVWYVDQPDHAVRAGAGDRGGGG